MAELEISCLGTPELRLAGASVTGLRTEKMRALVCYLAVDAKPHTRTDLSGLFWSDLPEEDARNNLRVSLTSLRKLLPEHLLITRETIAFNFSAPYTLDVEVFESAFYDEAKDEVSRLRKAVTLYRGDFLQGVDLPGAGLFDEWMVAQRERLQQLALRALHALADEAIKRRDLTGGADHLACLLAIDPWREEAHRQLMLLLATSGQQGAALAQYERCRVTLAEALGAEPSSETTALARRIERGEVEVELPSSARRHLPLPATPLIGREAFLAQLVGWFDGTDMRLVTLTGTGGVGKTRLALELAWALRGDYPDGVYFVPLAALSNHELVASAILQVLDIHDGGSQQPVEQLKAYLRDRRALLLLDNFEHLLPAAALVADLLAYSPRLKVLATSREPLHLRGEQELVVSPLPVPDLHDFEAAVGLPTLQTSPSVLLFDERARAVKADFALTLDNVREVVQICARLDGLPLAIELVAARIKLLSPKAILDRLGHRLDLLALDSPDLPPRHRTLRATLGWSYSLLTDKERQLFKRLAVTAGGCNLSLAAALTGEANELLILELLTSLVDKSLLWRMSGEDNEPRLGMLAVVSEYASEMLARDSQEVFDTQERHARHFANLLDQLYPDVFQQDYREAKAQIELELENIRAAWLWSAAWRPSLLQQAPLFGYFSTEGRLQEGIELFSEALRLLGNRADPELLARFTGSLAWLYYRVGRMQDALDAAIRSVAASRLTRRPDLLAAALETLGGVQLGAGDFSEAKASYLEALELSKSSDLTDTRARLQFCLGLVMSALGDYREALRLHEQVEDSREQETLLPHSIWANNLTGMGIAYRLSGNISAARKVLQEAHDLGVETDNPFSRINAVSELGLTAAAQGDYRGAVTYFDETLRLASVADDPTFIVLAQLGFAQVALETDNSVRTALHLRQALHAVVGTGLTPILLRCLLQVAELLISSARPGDAGLFLSQVAGHPAAQASDRAGAQRLLVEIGLAADDRYSVMSEMNPNAVVGLALSALEDVRDVQQLNR